MRRGNLASLRSLPLGPIIASLHTKEGEYLIPARMLIIEDNQANLDLMTFLLNAFGHTPLVAHDGVEGLEIARREEFDLIICDVQMPAMDGYEVARQLKNDPRLCQVPLVAVTALAMVGDRDKVLAAGFDGYIAKPIAPRTFVQQVESFLQPGQHSTVRQQYSPTLPPPALGTRHTTILMVDNLPANIEVIRSTLEPFGYKVAVANNVTEGLALARQSPPDLILSDLHMPGENGLDFIRAAKADPQLRAIPFVILSSTAQREMDWGAVLVASADKFISRPIKPQVLLAEIEACLQKAGKGSRGDAETG